MLWLLWLTFPASAAKNVTRAGHQRTAQDAGEYRRGEDVQRRQQGRLTPILAKIDKPVLYVCEAQLESQGKLLLQNVPRRGSVFKDAGHALFVDKADRFNKLIADFVESSARPQK